MMPQRNGLLSMLLGRLRRKPEQVTDLVELDLAQLQVLPDEQLGQAYYRLRDEAAPGAAPHYYPKVGRLCATPLEREKDRREARRLAAQQVPIAMQLWYQMAAQQPCTWWLEHHLVARHSLHSCMSCGVCTAQCPAARYYDDYNPRHIVDVALSGDENRLVELLCSDMLWLCGQCGSCKPGCPRGNSIVGLVSSLRLLAQLKGYHQQSMRGRQQYAARHLWGGNFWNRGCSFHFRHVRSEDHPDFGPRFARYWSEVEQQMSRLGADPDRGGDFGGRKIEPETLQQLRQCVRWGGTLLLWNALEDAAGNQAAALGISRDEYFEKVRSEG
jgi:heterodisulfide reductase subunit C